SGDQGEAQTRGQGGGEERGASIQSRAARRDEGAPREFEGATRQRPGSAESGRNPAEGGARGHVAVADANPPPPDGVSAARSDRGAAGLPGRHGRARADRPAAGRPTRGSVGPDRSILRAWGAAVGPPLP